VNGLLQADDVDGNLTAYAALASMTHIGLVLTRSCGTKYMITEG